MRAVTVVSAFLICVLSFSNDFANAQSSSTGGVVSAILQGLGLASSSSDVSTSSIGVVGDKLATQLAVYNFTNSTTSSRISSTTILLPSTLSSSTSSLTTESTLVSTTASLGITTSATVSSIVSRVNSTFSTSAQESTLPSSTSNTTSSISISSSLPVYTTALSNSSTALNGSSAWQTDTTSQRTANVSATWTVPSTGSGKALIKCSLLFKITELIFVGAAYASKCNQEWQSYFNISTNAITGTYTSYVSSYVVTNYSAPVTTICAGNTQINGPLVATASFTKPWTTGNSLYPPVITMAPTPSCTVPAADCSAIGITSDQYYYVPAGCSSSSTSESSSDASGGDCTIQGSDVQVIYFKPTTTANATQNLCAASPSAAAAANNDACPYGSFVTSTSTWTTTFTGVTDTATTTYLLGSISETQELEGSKLYTTVYTETDSECVYSSAAVGYQNRTASYVMSDGYEYYEDMVYLSFKSVWAVNSAGSTVGTPRAGSLVPMPSSEVYSVCTRQAGQAAYSYNFNDLSGYVPASAWNCQPYCEMVWNEYASGHGGPSQELPNDTPEGLAAVMPAGPGDFYINDQLVFSKEGGYCGGLLYQSWYKPYIAVPPQVRALDPAWGSCVLAFEGWYDPPTALTQVASTDGPSSPTAAPASTPQPAPAQTTTQISTTSTAQPSNSLATIATQTTASSNPQPTSTFQSSAVSVDDPSAQDPSSSSADPGVSTSSSSAAAVAASNILSALLSTSASSQQAAAVPVAGSADPATSSSVAQVAASNILSALASTSAVETVQSQANTDPASTQPGSSPPGTIEPSAKADPDSTQTSSSAAQIVASNILSAPEGTSTISQQVATSAPPSTPSASPAIASSVTSINDPGLTSQSTVHTTVNVAGISVTIAQNPASSNAVIDGTTVAQGSQATVNGQTTSVGSQGVQVGSTYVSAVQDPQTTQSVAQATIGSSAFTVAVIADPTGSSSIIVAAGGSTATLAAGQTTNLGGQVVSAPTSGGLVVGSGSSAKTVAPSAISSPSPPSSTLVTIQGQSFTAAQSGSAVLVAGISSTLVLSQGATGVIDGKTVTAASGDPGIIVGGSIALLSQAPSATTQAVITGNAGQSITLIQQGQSFSLIGSSSTVVLAAGASTTFAGQTISVPTSTGPAHVNGNTVILSTATTPFTSIRTQAVVSSNGGQAVTVLQQGSSYEVQVGTSVAHLTAGGVTTIAGATISAPTSGSVLLVNGQSAALSTQRVPSTTIAAVITGSSSQLATVLQSGSSYIVEADSTTFALTQGSATLVNGVTLSMPPSGSAPLANGKTVSWSTMTASSQQTVATQAALTGVSSKPFTVVQQGSSFLVQDSSSTVTLAAGSRTLFEGATISMPVTGSGVIANGQTVPLSTVGSVVSGSASSSDTRASTPTLSHGSSSSVPATSSAGAAQANGGGHQYDLKILGSASLCFAIALLVLMLHV